MRRYRLTVDGVRGRRAVVAGGLRGQRAPGRQQRGLQRAARGPEQRQLPRVRGHGQQRVLVRVEVGQRRDAAPGAPPRAHAQLGGRAPVPDAVAERSSSGIRNRLGGTFPRGSLYETFLRILIFHSFSFHFSLLTTGKTYLIIILLFR